MPQPTRRSAPAPRSRATPMLGALLAVGFALVPLMLLAWVIPASAPHPFAWADAIA